jgi:hypothetical protein
VLRANGVATNRIGYESHGPYVWTQQHWPEYQQALRSFQPTDVIMIFGTNEGASSRLDAALRQFKSSAARVWYSGPPRYDRVPEQQGISAEVRQLAARVFGNRYLDAWPYTGTAAQRTPDGLHFTIDGAASWAWGMASDLADRLRSADLVVPAVFAVAGVVGAVALWLWLRR